MRVADYIMSRLVDRGVEHIFMVTGRGALFLTDAVAAQKKLKPVCMHHEQSAAFAAVAYAHYRGLPGACLVSTGCAGTNTITGVLNAWQDGIPCVFISGQNKLSETTRFSGKKIRTFGQQEADIIPMVETITKYAVMITDPKKIAYEIDKALYLSEEGRKGPVWIDVPLDVQNMRIDPLELERFFPEKKPTCLVAEQEVVNVARMINESSRPIILLGSGIWHARAESELREFSQKFKVPVVFSGSAPDIIGSSETLSIGSVGAMACSRAGNFAIQNADLILVIGNRLSPMTTGTEYCKFGRAAKIIVIDVDPEEHRKETVRVDHFIEADAKAFLADLLKCDIKCSNESWTRKCLHWKEIFPACEKGFRSSDRVDLYDLSDEFSNLLAENAVFVSDSGLVELILPTNIRFKKGQRCIHPSSQGSMGFALPGAIGAHFASSAPTVAVIGDGSLMMNLQEFATIRHHKIPTKIFVINNNVYGIIRKRQSELFGSRTIGTDPSDGVSCPEFEQVAKCFDIQYRKINSSKNLRDELASVMAMEGPLLCEIMGLENQSYITSSHARNSQKAIVRRPLEDQAPYLERDLFLTEMIIDPVDQ